MKINSTIRQLQQELLFVLNKQEYSEIPWETKSIIFQLLTNNLVQIADRAIQQEQNEKEEMVEDENTTFE